MRAAALVAVVGVVATATATFVRPIRKRVGIAPIVVIGAAITLGVLAWNILDSSENKLLRCTREAAEKPTPAGVQIAVQDCRSLYGPP